MASDLAQKQCRACESGTPSLKGEDLARYRAQLQPEWRVVDDRRLERDFRFSDFREALAWTNRVAEVAEEEGHHPDIFLAWGKVRLTFWTHASGGLTENDFIMAAKIDALKARH